MHPKESNILAEKQISKLTALSIMTIIFLGVFLYSNTLNAPFIFDDYGSIVDNDTIKNFKTSLKDIPNNRYLTSVIFAVNYLLGDLTPFGYHLINNIIHIINALLVYYLVVLTFKTPYFSSQQSALHQFVHSPIHSFTHSPLFIAFSSAFIFISHPVQTQAVTYIAQRATSMATMFYLLSLVMYIKWRLRMQDTVSSGNSQGRGEKIQDRKNIMHRASWIIYLCSIISAIFAMKTKEIAFTLPIIITFFEFSFFNSSPSTGPRKSNFKRVLYLLPILLTLLIIPLSMVNFKAPVEAIAQDMNIQSRETVNITRTDYFLTQFRVIVTYLRLLVLPINQSLDYSYPVYRSFFDVNVFLSFSFLLLMVAVAVYLFYRSRFTVHSSQTLSSKLQTPNSRLISFGIFWFFITLSVESSIIPIRDVIVEHRLYLPSIGFFIASVSLMSYLIVSVRLKVVIIVVIVGLLSIGTYNRNMIWKDPEMLWEDVLVKFPNNVRAHNGLGVIFKEREEYDRALIQFEKVLKINSNYVPAYYNIGDIYYRLGKHKIALAYFIKVLKLNPSFHFHLDTLNSLAITYSEISDDRNAVSTFKEAIKIFPSSVMLYNNLGRQYIKMGNFDDAIEILKKGLGVREEPYLRSNLSIAYSMKARQKTKD